MGTQNFFWFSLSLSLGVIEIRDGSIIHDSMDMNLSQTLVPSSYVSSS